MSRVHTNYATVRRLILKDWYLNRRIILGSIPVGLASLAIVFTGKQIAYLISVILVSMIVIGVGSQLAITTTIYERKEQTLPFIMSLPVSWREYTAAKILANLIIFLIPWLIISACVLGVLLLPGAPHGLVPFTTIMAVEMLVSICLTLAAGLITESQAGITIAIMASALGLDVLGFIFAHLRGISSYMWGASVRWTPTAWLVLLAELLTVPLLLGLSFYIQSRKTDFL
jgi:ABC-2 type transport system permease protein